MRSLPIIFLGYLILFPHVFFSWREWFRTKAKKIRKKQPNLHWNLWLGTLSLALWVVLTAEGFRNEFSVLWFIYISAFTVLFLVWSIKFMPKTGKGQA